MKKGTIINVIKYILFLGLGVFLFYQVNKKIEFSEIIDAFKNEVNYFWIIVSVLFAILSQVSRTLRWIMLIKPMGYNPRFKNVFLSVFVLYLVNLLFPRAGEVARCTIVAKTDNIPVPKLVGTVIVERLADTLMLGVLAVVIITWNFTDILNVFNCQPELKENLQALLSVRNIMLGFTGVALLVFLVLYLRKRNPRKVAEPKESLMHKLIEGLKSFSKLENKLAFFLHTCFIFLMWLVMLYVIFLAYPPTEHLSIRIGMVTFLMGGLAMIAPIQGGMGAYHWMITITLSCAYGISENHGVIFANIAWATTNLSYIFLGGIALVILFLTNKKSLGMSNQNTK